MLFSAGVEPTRIAAWHCQRNGAPINRQSAPDRWIETVHNQQVFYCNRARRAAKRLRDYFLLFGLWPAGVLPAANGLTGAAPPFLRFLSAFGFFFSLLLRICPLALTISLAPGRTDVALPDHSKFTGECI